MSLDTKLISQEINTLLWESNETLSTAESCTAGRIAAALTAVPGSSDYYRGGLVCYSNEVKINMLHVSPDTLDQHSAVSEEVVREMVEGCRKVFGTTYAIAITGYAGPVADSNVLGASMIVGTIWIAVTDGDQTLITRLTEDNGRERNLTCGTREALRLLTELIRKRRQ